MSNIYTPDLNINQKEKRDYTTIIIIVALVAVVCYFFFSNYSETFDTKNTQNTQNMEMRPQSEAKRMWQENKEERQERLMNKMMEAQAASKPSNRPEISSRESELLANSQMLTSGLINKNLMLRNPNNVQQRWIDDSNNVIINDDIPDGSTDRQTDDVGCNLSQNLSTGDRDELKDFKNKFYSTYAHQVECANKNQNILTGCGKKCYPGSRQMKKCADSDEACLKEYEMLNNGADTTSLNFLALKNNNKKDCVTCTFDKLKYTRAEGVESILNQLYGGNNVFEHDYLLNDAERGSVFDNRARNSTNRSLNNGDSSAPAFDSDSFMEHFENTNTNTNQTQTQTKLQESEQISAELKKKDEMLAQKKKVSFDNCNKFANFADYIEQNGVMGTSVDKLAEVRTQDSATCGLKSYGKNISDVYDKLVSTPYMDYKKSCNLDNVGGVFEDASPTSEFASVQ
jgi:hypothetical protein